MFNIDPCHKLNIFWLNSEKNFTILTKNNCKQLPASCFEFRIFFRPPQEPIMFCCFLQLQNPTFHLPISSASNFYLLTESDHLFLCRLIPGPGPFHMSVLIEKIKVKKCPGVYIKQIDLSFYSCRIPRIS